MKLQARCYDKIALMDLSEEITGEDLKELDAELEKLVPKLNTIILTITNAKIKKPEFVFLAEMRDRFAQKKIKFLITSSNHPEADAKEIVEALDSLDTTHAGRIITNFTKEHKLNVLKSELARVQEEMAALLFNKKEEKAEESLTPEQFSQAIYQLREQNKKLQVLYKTFVSENDNIQKMRKATKAKLPASDDAKAAVKEIKKRALSTIKAANILE